MDLHSVALLCAGAAGGAIAVIAFQVWREERRDAFAKAIHQANRESVSRPRMPAPSQPPTLVRIK